MMSVIDFPTNITKSRSRDLHISDHNRIHQHMNQTVHSVDYNDLQTAVIDAIAKKRPLIIAPGSYRMTSPLLISDAHNLTVFAYGALLTCDVPLNALVEIKESQHVAWYGGMFKPQTETQNALYIHGGGTGLSNIKISDLMINGDYVTGIRVGEPNSGVQCDHIYFDNITLFGSWVAGDSNDIGDCGIYLGSGRWANLLNLSVNRLNASGHNTHVHVDATSYVSLTNLGLDRSDTADILNACSNLVVQSARSEEAKRFLISSGTGTSIFMCTLSNIRFHAQEIASDGQWIKYYYAGGLTLNNIHAHNNPETVNPTVFVAPPAPLQVHDLGVFNSDIETNRNVTVK